MNVVLIDDTPIVLARLKRLVGTLPGCHVMAFESALEALAWCEANEPDLVVVDYHLPGMDGLEFVLRLRRFPETLHVPVIMVTQDHDRDVRHRALTIGIDDFLTKPFDQAEVHARVQNMLALRSRQKAVAARAASLAEEVKRAASSLRAREQEALACLACAAEHRDPETHEHLLRMSHYSELIARELDLPDAECELVLHSARLHDVGKIATPDDILLKPDLLTPAEVQIMRAHTTMGYQILESSSSPILRAGAQIALSHHERFDGTGYPAGLAKEAIPLHSRIVAVADVFDALTTTRSYKNAWGVDRAARYIREGSGSQFDPQCVTAFCKAWSKVLDVKARFPEGAESRRRLASTLR